MRRGNAAVNAIEAEREPVSRTRRCDRIGPPNLFTPYSVNHRDELARSKRKIRDFRNFKFEMANVRSKLTRA